MPWLKTFLGLWWGFGWGGSLKAGDVVESAQLGMGKGYSYLLHTEVGRGAHGVVFVVEDVNTQKLHAMKVKMIFRLT